MTIPAAAHHGGSTARRFNGSSHSVPPRQRKQNGIPVVVVIGLCLASFFAGSLWAGVARLDEAALCNNSNQRFVTTVPQQQQQQGADHNQMENLVQKSRVMEEVNKLLPKLHGEETNANVDNNNDQSRFPPSTRKFATGVARVTKHEFTTTFDMGVPVNLPVPGKPLDEVLILYNTKSLPTQKQYPITNTKYDIPLLSAENATENCDHLHMILTDASNRKQCLALIPQYESFHIQNWMRVPKEEGKLDSSLPLRMTSRGHQPNGRQQFSPPKPILNTQRHWDMLSKYFQNKGVVLKELGVLAKQVAKDNTIIVMVCNHGQSELLMNFVCSAKARGLDVSQILLFATDIETKELAEGLGLTVYHDYRNFQDTPSEAAQMYGDRKFVAMMMAKIYCVQLISMLGYNILLFQDVDVIWFHNPLPYFENKSGPIYDFDAYFQEDGNRQLRFAPYSANSGFYYLRHNVRTQHFLTSILMAGDLVLRTFSHQAALIAVLNEHASLYGLRVKVLSRDLDEFPGGYHFHMKTGRWMKAFFAGQKDPIIFHMSWTNNKDNKILFFRQMGEWYLQDLCIGTTAKEILAKEDGGSSSSSLVTECCSATPLFSCHYRDKASKYPCHDSPNIDSGRAPFW